MALQLTDTRVRRKVPFVPRTPGHVSMYLCGPTVYAEPHIGNLRNVVVFDVLRRHLSASGYDVVLVRNITDIDDKIITASGDDPFRAAVLAEHWTRVYERLTEALGVLPPTLSPRATGHIPQMVALVQALEDAGLAYQSAGDVYFSVSRWPAYGALSGRDVSQLRAGERVEANTAKRDPLDFVLWKSSRPGEPQWTSPWGPGRPGWHLECAAMAGAYLGAGFDIHGGGEDLLFPHHENEVAEFEGATGTPFARYWVHNAFLEVRGEKMSKSVGNVTSPTQLLEHVRGPVLRYGLLAAHYRSPLEWSSAAVNDAAGAYDRLSTFARNAAGAVALHEELAVVASTGMGHASSEAAAWEQQAVAALDDDLAVPAALAVLFELVAASSPLIVRAESGDRSAATELASRLAVLIGVLGRLGFEPLAEMPPGRATAALLALVLQLRERARAARDYAAADVVRDHLLDAGVRIEDGPSGPRWHPLP